MNDVPFGHLVESTSHTALSQGPDLLLGTRFSVGVRCSALLANTRADHMSIHGHKPQGASSLASAMDLDWSWPWGCPRKERWEQVMSFSFCFFWWPANAACRILVPQLRIESTPSAVKVQSPNHSKTTREFPAGHFLSLADGPEV